MEHINNRIEVASNICEEYKSIYRLVYHEGRIIKFNATNVKAFYESVKEELKLLATLSVDYTSKILEAENVNSFNEEVIMLTREYFKELSSLLAGTAYLSVGIDYAFSLLIEDEVTGQTEAKVIYEILLNALGKGGKNKIEAHLISKVICSAMVLVSIQSTILTQILNTHES